MSNAVVLEAGRWYRVEASLREIYGFPEKIKLNKGVTSRVYGGRVCLTSDDSLLFIGDINSSRKSKLVKLATEL